MELLFVNSKFSLVSLTCHHQVVNFPVIDSIGGLLAFKDFLEEVVSFQILDDLPEFVGVLLQTESFGDHIKWGVHGFGEICEVGILYLKALNFRFELVDQLELIFGFFFKLELQLVKVSI